MLVPYFKNISMLCKLQPLTSRITRRLHEHVKSFNAEKLNNRKVIRISGESSLEFLQGLITNDMRNLQNTSNSIYTMFLNNKGRVLYDAFIFKTSENNTFFLDCDSQCTEQLVKHLKLYKVRRKIDIIPVDSEYCVWSIYDTNLIDSLQQNLKRNEYSKLDIESVSNGSDIIVVDPRLSVLGYRCIIRSNENVKLPLNDKYKICRYKLGVGEGVDEFEIGQCFPLEVNCDYLNGVSFDKGCYIGQELTARTFHTGVVRKRLMPLTFSSEPKEVPQNTAIDDPEVSRRSPIGKIKGYYGNLGLGVMRVSETLESKSLKMLEFVCRASVPYWWPPDSVQQNYVKKIK